MNKSTFVVLMILSTITACSSKTNEPVLRWQSPVALPALAEEAYAHGVAGAVAGVHQGIFIMAGGANFPGKMPWEGGAKKYYATGVVTDLNKEGTIIDTFQLRQPIAYAAVCSMPEGVVYAGGENDQGITDEVILLKWDSTTKQLHTAHLPSLPQAITNGMMVYANGYLFFGGGETADGASSLFWMLDTKAREAGWQSLPSLPVPVSHAVMTAWQENKSATITIFGGRKKNKQALTDWYDTVFQFDLGTRQWQRRGKLPYALAAGTGVQVSNQWVCLFGGDKGDTFRETEKILLQLATEQSAEHREELLKKKAVLQAAHPGFSHTIIFYNTQTDKYDIRGELPFATPVTTTLVQDNNKIILPSGEIRAGVRSPYIQSAILENRQP